MEVKAERVNVVKGRCRQSSIRVLRNRNPEERSQRAEKTRLALKHPENAQDEEILEGKVFGGDGVAASDDSFQLVDDFTDLPWNIDVDQSLDDD